MLVRYKLHLVMMNQSFYCWIGFVSSLLKNFTSVSVMVLCGDTSLAKFLVWVEFYASSRFLNMCVLSLASKDSSSFLFLAEP